MARETPPPRETPPERKKRLLEQMDQWVSDIDEVLGDEPDILKSSRS